VMRRNQYNTYFLTVLSQKLFGALFTWNSVYLHQEILITCLEIGSRAFQRRNWFRLGWEYVQSFGLCGT
jgi:hypothetical protein